MNIPALLKELAKISAIALTEETTKVFIETKIKPIFVNWGKDDLRSIELEECLSEYLLRCYAKNNIMTTIVFGRLQKTLDDLYIPLTLEEYRNENKRWIINENCYDILNNYSRILIVDMAGMGKSTIVKYFACQGVNLGESIPIVIELRRLEKNQTILDYIQRQINSLDKNIEVEEIVNILKKGDFVVFFDGYDEVANENKPDILDAIQEFTSKANNTKIVITSREEDDLNSLGEYKCVNIKPLIEEEAYELIKKYDNNGEISKKLIKRLNEDSSMDILKEFLENPLLVSLLYKTFEYKEEIPYKKIDFYEQVYDALFNDHDKTKGSAYTHEKKTKLDRYQFEQILRAFGFLSLKTDKVEYSSQLIHQLLKQSIERFGWLKISVDDFLYDITHAVPFIQRDGNEYKWVHKSFMEYFASCFICYDNKELEERYLNKMVSVSVNMKYYNVLSFCYEIDTLNFRKCLILPYIKKYIEPYPNFFKQEYFNEFNKESLKMAKQILALNIKSWIIRNDHTDKLYDLSIHNGEPSVEFHNTLDGLFQRYKYKFDYDKIKLMYTYKQQFVYAFTKKNMTLYKIIEERLPEIFDDITIELNHTKNIRNNIRKDFKIQLDDNISNPICSDKEIFSSIVGQLYISIFNSLNVLNYNKCKVLITEIESENKVSSSDNFDW